MGTEKKCHLAVDIGASSGRHIIGFLDEGKVVLKEVYRFENNLIKRNGHLCWDLESLYNNVVLGIKAAMDAGFAPETMGIDTWGVDFVLLDSTGNILGDTVAYRDERTEGIRDELESLYRNGDPAGISFAHQYAKTGIQYQRFNSCYQLASIKKTDPQLLAKAKSFLMIPDYLAYRLTGIISNEYTNATTTGLVNAKKCNWDLDLISSYGLPTEIFGKLNQPGDLIGPLKDEILADVGIKINVISPATHDTGSAYIAVPARTTSSVFLSSGTWSLMGVENSSPITSMKSMDLNFTNEGGIEHRFRYLKNIMGLWMIQSVRRELGAATGTKPSFPELIAEAKKYSSLVCQVDVDDDAFLAPDSMIEAIKKACAAKGVTISETGEIMQCIYQSLTYDYAKTIRELEDMTGKHFDAINIVGGGCQDDYLNQMTADVTHLPVYAGPIEGTSLGNIISQMMAAGEITSLAKARDIIADSFDIKKFEPQSL